MSDFCKTCLFLGLFFAPIAAAAIVIGLPHHSAIRLKQRTPDAGCIWVVVDEKYSTFVEVRYPDGSYKLLSNEKKADWLLKRRNGRPCPGAPPQRKE